MSEKTIKTKDTMRVHELQFHYTFFLLKKPFNSSINWSRLQARHWCVLWLKPDRRKPHERTRQPGARQVSSNLTKMKPNEKHSSMHENKFNRVEEIVLALLSLVQESIASCENSLSIYS